MNELEIDLKNHNNIIDIIKKKLIGSNSLIMKTEKIAKYLDLNFYNDEILMCSLKNNIDKQKDIEYYKKQININIENLEQDKIKSFIEKILDENDFYHIFFSIMKCGIVKTFFTKKIMIKNNNGEYEYKLITNENEGSESIKEMYDKFLNLYDKEGDNYKDFKKLFIIKILSKSDRVCLFPELKKIIINPSQFYFSKELNDSEIEVILKLYLLIILLYETEHFLILLQDEIFYVDTPRGDKLFIKYLFGVEIINNIDVSQATKILSIEEWKNHETIKSIFIGQKDSVINTNENPKSISYYTTKYEENNEINKNNTFVKY